MKRSRREFMIQGSAALAAAGLLAGSTRTVRANAMGRPIGLSLYSLKEQLGKDFDGTLEQVAAIGYREVEMEDFFGKKPNEIKKSLDNAGLHCGSIHIVGAGGVPEALEHAAAIGAKYVVSPVIPSERVNASILSGVDMAAFLAMLNSLTLEDYKAAAEQCNQIGERAKKAGLQFAYHNHNFEFRPLGGTTGYDELLRSTDPKLVKMELDCGYVVAVGHDPVAYLTKYPDRYRLLHIKDVKLTAKPAFDEPPESAALGRGQVNYKAIFAAARRTSVEWYYAGRVPTGVEEMPAMEMIKVNYEYLHRMK